VMLSLPFGLPSSVCYISCSLHHCNHCITRVESIQGVTPPRPPCRYCGALLYTC
jgi:hypothetical protein